MKQLLQWRVALLLLLGVPFSVVWGQVSTFDYTGGMVSYTVPPGATEINITCYGAQGASGQTGYVGGLGAQMSGDFTVTPGDVIILAVGGEGQGQNSGSNGGGGGGSFAVLSDPGAPNTIASGPFAGTDVTPLVIAGGGGGTRSAAAQNGNPGVTGVMGTSGSGSSSTGGGVPVTGATLGGAISGSSWGSGGGGFVGNGANDGTWGNGGSSFLNGAAGGTGGTGSGDNAAGGFGCGGQGRGSWGGGGGGGYSGGQGGLIGGGGGSYNSGANQDNITGVNSGDGQIIITVLCDGLVPDISAVEVCEGEEVTLSAVSTNGGTVTWDGGVTDGVAFTPPVGLNTYNATSSHPDDCEYQIDILVNANPTVTLSATDTEICDGETVTFTSGGDADTYVFDPADVIDGVPYTPAGLGTATYTVTGTDGATGCESEASIDVLVNASPVVTASASETEICEGETVIFTSTGDADSYSWDPADIVEGVPYTPEDGAFEATITGTFDATGCSTESTVIVDVLPSPFITATSGDESYCLGETLVLGAGGDADVIVWDPMDLEPGVGTHTYTVTGTYEGSVCESTASIDIVVHDLPTVTASVDNDVICKGLPIIVTGGGAEDYVWSPGTITDGMPFIPGEPGDYTYTVVGTDENDCSNEATVDVTVTDDIEISYTVIEEMMGDDGEIDITVTGGAPAYTFDWSNDGTGDFDDPEDLTGLSEGFYIVEVIGAGGCEGSATIILGSQLGIFDVEADAITVYPNPTTENVTIEFDGTFDYVLSSVTGAVILQGNAYNKEIVNMESLSDGIYFVTIKANGEANTVKIIKK